MTLFKMLFKSYLLVSLTAIASLIAFILLFELNFFSHLAAVKQKPFSMGVMLTLCDAPMIATQLLPIGAVLAVFIVGASLARRGELVAMHAFGLSPWRIYLPMVTIAALYGALLFAVANFAMPRAVERSDHILLYELDRWNATQRYFNSRRSWFRSGQQLVRIGDVDVKGRAYLNMTLLELRQGHIERRIFAERVGAEAGHFAGEKVLLERFTQPQGAPGTAPTHDTLNYEPLARFMLPLPADFDAFSAMTVKPQKLSLSGLKRIFSLRRHQGYDPTLYEVEYWSRIALPFYVWVMVLGAAIIALRADVKRPLWRTGLECVGFLALGFIALNVSRQAALMQSCSARTGAFLPIVMVALTLVGMRVREYFPKRFNRPQN